MDDGKNIVEAKNTIETKNIIEELMKDHEGNIEDVIEGVTHKFSLWVSDKVGGGNATQLVVFLSTNAVLETAASVLNIGTGFTQLNTTGFTLHSIKNTVETIEKKVNVILDTPLKKALDYSQSFLLKMINKSYERAFENLKKVLDEAMTAFYYTAVKKSSVESYEERMTSVLLIIFCTILSESYNKEKKCFLPYAMLSDSEKAIIGGEIEMWVRKSLEAKTKINAKSFFQTDLKKKNTLQNHLDDVLRIAYPYISESKKLTSIKTKISPTVNDIEIKLDPSLLPYGEEDYTLLMLGERKHDDGTYINDVKIKVWRTETEVYCKYTYGSASQSLMSTKKFKSENDIIDMTVGIPSMIVITGDGKMPKGHCLGVYVYDHKTCCYKQVATVVHHNPAKQTKRYVFQYTNYDEWFIGSNPGKREGWMKMESDESDTLPLTDWMFWNGKKWVHDPSIKIQYGDLPSEDQCGDIEIKLKGFIAEKKPMITGSYNRNGDYYNGKPIFVNKNGQYLHSGDDGSWWVGPQIGKYSIYSKTAGMCPAQIQSWEYWTQSGDKPAGVTITCSTHSSLKRV